MRGFAAGARRLPLHHVTIRVPWHDGGWTGTVCARPLDNSSCLILPRIGEGRRDEVEARCASQRLDELDRADLPPCVGEHVSFMAPFALTRMMTHPYTEFYPETHGHFAPTGFAQPAYSAACVPYRWMLREKSRGEREGWRDRDRRASEDRVDAGPRARHPQSAGQTGQDGLGPRAREPARAARHLLRRAPAGGVALLLLCQAQPRSPSRPGA